MKNILERDEREEESPFRKNKNEHKEKTINQDFKCILRGLIRPLSG